MKLTAAALAATAGLALAQPRLHERHDHRHLHRPHHVKRVPDAVTKEVYLPGPTVFVYELNGHLISEDEVRQGIANGTLRLGDDGVLSSAAPSPSPSSSSAAAVFAEAVHTSQPASSTPASSSPAPVTSAAAASSSSSSSGSYSSGGGIDSDYDESVDCGTFPSAFGPVALDYLGLGGWTGIQNPGYTGSDGYNNIETLTSGSCSEGMFCSYACPAGYQKTQWPTNQGVTGQSVGGLKCSGGKLKLTRTSTKKLCERGTSAVSIKVKNTMSKGAAICRTDYPGTESETIPVWAAAGSSADLACPDGASYYQKDGKATSAQYYVNPAGVSTEEGCQWGDSSQDVGNWAPLNIGVGYSSGKGWISIFQNAPTTTSKLDFTVEIQGDDISGTCRYSNGQYCSGSDYGTCNTSSGCTVAVNSGTAYFVFS